MDYDELLKRVDEVVASAPSFPRLRRAVKSHLASLYGKERAEDQIQHYQPHKMLTAHAGVWGAKSARAKTLRELADKVFAETGLPRNSQGMFRGMDGIDLRAFEASLEG